MIYGLFVYGTGANGKNVGIVIFLLSCRFERFCFYLEEGEQT